MYIVCVTQIYINTVQTTPAFVHVVHLLHLYDVLKRHTILSTVLYAGCTLWFYCSAMASLSCTPCFSIIAWSSPDALTSETKASRYAVAVASSSVLPSRLGTPMAWKRLGMEEVGYGRGWVWKRVGMEEGGYVRDRDGLLDGSEAIVENSRAREEIHHIAQPRAQSRERLICTHKMNSASKNCTVGHKA